MPGCDVGSHLAGFTNLLRRRGATNRAGCVGFFGFRSPVVCRNPIPESAPGTSGMHPINAVSDDVEGRQRGIHLASQQRNHTHGRTGGQPFPCHDDYTWYRICSSMIFLGKPCSLRSRAPARIHCTHPEEFEGMTGFLLRASRTLCIMPSLLMWTVTSARVTDSRFPKERILRGLPGSVESCLETATRMSEIAHSFKTGRRLVLLPGFIERPSPDEMIGGARLISATFGR
jgi:hypothetical protein